MRAPALTGVLAALTIVLGLGGFSTMRRATIWGIPGKALAVISTADKIQ